MAEDHSPEVQRLLARRRAAQRARFARQSTSDIEIDLRELRETYAGLTAPEDGIESARVWREITLRESELRRREVE